MESRKKVTPTSAPVQRGRDREDFGASGLVNTMEVERRCV